MNKIIEFSMLAAIIICIVAMFISLLFADALRVLANLIDYHYWLDIEDTR